MGIYKDTILASNLIPWRVRHTLEHWSELKLRNKAPFFYRLLHFGRGKDMLRPVTKGPKHHFFGYYEKTPWDTTGDYILAHEVAFNNRAPTEKDSLKIGIVRTKEKNEFASLASSNAWNWQQGAMLQWHPTISNCIMYNDKKKGRFVGIIKERTGKTVAVYNYPFYAVSPDGRKTLGLNFSRLHKYRPGYGYAGVADPWENEVCPEKDGIFMTDLDTFRTELVLSTGQLVRKYQEKYRQNTPHWLNHIQISPSGKRFAFFLLWDVGGGRWGVKLIVSNFENYSHECVLDWDTISHYDWMDNEHLLIWAKKDGKAGHFLLINVCNGSYQIVGQDTLTQDGHCSFSGDKGWVLNDTYPDEFDMRTLMIFRVSDQKRIDISRLYSPKDRWWGENRCDLHPRWSRDGKSVCIDSVHTGERQMYIINVEQYLKE